MQKLYPLLVFYCFLGAPSFAQQRIIVGYLKDGLTHFPIANGNINNATARLKARSDGKGFFLLQVAPNDLVYAMAPNYRFDTLRYSTLFQDTITIYLNPSGDLLENVTVRAGYEKYQMDSVARRKDFEEARGHTLRTIAQSHQEGFGLVINLDRFFKAKYKNKRKDERVLTDIEKQAYVDYRFPPQLVAFYTGLKGEELLRFMRQYRPAYEWLRQHPLREQVLDYISAQLKKYRSDGQRLNNVARLLLSIARI